MKSPSGLVRAALAAMLLSQLRAGSAFAQHDIPAEPGTFIEGRVNVSAEGHVTGFVVEGEIGEDQRHDLDQLVRRWQFEEMPSANESTRAYTWLRAKLIEVQDENGDMQLRLAEPRFGARGALRPVKAPRYPEDAIRAGLSAKIVVALLFGADGRVQKTHVVQISLYGRIEDPKLDQRFRGYFAKAAIKAMEKWEVDFSDLVEASSTYATLMPVEFNVGRRDGKVYAIVPGPISKPAWFPDLPVDAQGFAGNGGQTETPPPTFWFLDTRFRLLDEGSAGTD